jgi:hypothetical protein
MTSRGDEVTETLVGLLLPARVGTHYTLNVCCIVPQSWCVFSVGLEHSRRHLPRLCSYLVEFPHVEGSERLLKRVKTECAVMRQLDDGRMERTPHRVQGVLNNLNGLRAEYGIVRTPSQALRSQAPRV